MTTDNVSISQPVPFAMLKGDLPWVDATARRWVTLPSPALAASYLRFMGIGTGLQVSFNGGQSWQNAQMHPVEQSFEDHFKPYWMAVPAGTTRLNVWDTDQPGQRLYERAGYALVERLAGKRQLCKRLVSVDVSG